MGESLGQAWPDWVKSPPIYPGLYLYKNSRDHLHRLLIVEAGQWQQAQNPAELYAGGKRLRSFGSGWWLGPIPKAPAG